MSFDVRHLRHSGGEPRRDYGKTRDVVDVGQVVSGKYRLLRLLGDGGMGSVYEAEHLTLGTHVAIKVLHADLARRAGIAERFLQEARVSAQIRSPHVVQVTDVDRTPDGVAYLVMELLQGEPLSSVMKRQRQMPLPTAAEYTSQILLALEAAHALGVIHRDLKPDNVFVTFHGGKPVLKLIDFGIAKLKTAQAGQTKNLTVAGMLMGTPEYMAPEQAYSADKVDVRADLYAVGVMLYEMLAGQPPATADDPRVLILKIERGEVTPLVNAAPGIRPEVAGFVHRAMAPRAELRFANATEMRLALDDVLAGKRPVTAKLGATSAAVDPALAATADARPDVPRAEIGTGTVMGAPVDAALTNPSAAMSMGPGIGPMGSMVPAQPYPTPGSGPPPPMAGGTVGAPPMTGYGPPPMQPMQPMQPPPAMHPPAHAVPMPPPPMAQPQRSAKGGNGLIIALAAVALLLGAGAVVTYVVSTQPSKPVAPDFGPLGEPPTATTAVTTTPPTATTTTPVTPVTPLTTSTVTPPSPAPAPGPSPQPKPDAGGGQAQRDAGTQPAPADAGSGQTKIVTPFGTFEFPGPRPPFYPPNEPWPPPNPIPVPQ